MLELFINLLSKAEAIVVGDSPLLSSWHQDDVIGETHNQVLYANWESEGHDYSVTINEAGLAQVSFNQETGEFNAFDHEGDPVTIKLFQLSLLKPD